MPTASPSPTPTSSPPPVATAIPHTEPEDSSSENPPSAIAFLIKTPTPTRATSVYTRAPPGQQHTTTQDEKGAAIGGGDSTTTTNNNTNSQHRGVITIGGRNRKHVVPGADVHVSLLAQQLLRAMQFACCGFAIATVVLLVAFHLLALISPVWLPPTATPPTYMHAHGGDRESSWLAPNTWELLVVVTFFQHISSLSMLVLTKAPFLVVDFTDSLSWTNFHLYAMGTQLQQQQQIHQGRRRLDYVILTGMVAYADRLGLHEGRLLAYTTRFFFVVVAVLVLCFLIAVLFHRRRSNRPAAEASTTTSTMHGKATLCFLGLAVAVWSLSVFPLCVSSSFELSMQLEFSITTNLGIVLFNLVAVLLGGLWLLAKSVGRIRTDRALAFHHFAVFGTLYAAQRRETRYTFVAIALFQICTGAIVGAVQENPTQLDALLILHGVALFALCAVRPYRKWLVNAFVGVLMVVRIVNLALATSFATASTMATSRRGTVATVLVSINFGVVLAIFFRQFLVFIYVLRRWSSYNHASKKTKQTTDYDDGNGSDEDRVTGGTDTTTHVEIQSARLGSEYDLTIKQFAKHSHAQSQPRPRPQALPRPLSPTLAHGMACENLCFSCESPVPNLANRPPPKAFRQQFSF